MKELDKLNKRADSLEEEGIILDKDGHGAFRPEMLEYYDAVMENIAAEQRRKRVKVVGTCSCKDYNDVWKDMTQIEINWYRGRWLRILPEQRAEVYGMGRTSISDAEVYKWFSDYKKHPRKNGFGHILAPPLGYGKMLP